jgi:hypothetical protein
VVKDDVQFLSLSDSLLECGDLDADFLAESSPSGLNIIDLIDVQLAGEGPEFLPDLAFDLDT